MMCGRVTVFFVKMASLERYDWRMAAIVHISEEEAARDFAAVMRRVRAGDEVIVEDGGTPVAVMRSPGTNRDISDSSKIPGKTLGEIVEGLRRWEAEHGPLVVDEDFAADVEEARRWTNQPMDDSKWD
jgi:antitoxin (DNA-binding transcriptional repressor) of toxin-antitoxin stability system